MEFLNQYAKEIFNNNMDKGFWDLHKEEVNSPIFKIHKIGLIITEAAEVIEAVRKPTTDKHIPQRSAEEVELADIVIRVLDYAAAYDLDLEGAILDKVEFNKNRPYRHGKEC